MRFATLLIVALVGACSGAPADRPGGDSGEARLSVMTFNVENLFDARHDRGKSDYTYLPAERKRGADHRSRCREINSDRWRDQCLNWDWNEAVVAEKLARIAQVILRVNGGRGADIVVLQEVENRAVLERLRSEYLAAGEYATLALVEGRDVRGIDVAFLSRLPLQGEPRLHHARSRGGSRGILEATFRLPDGRLLTGFAVHFPAPYHPLEARVREYEHLNGLLERLPGDRAAFAAGDFNTPAAEDRRHAVLERYVRPQWRVAHERCRDCRGTSYYAPRREWSFLDMILLARPAGEDTRGAGWDFAPESVRVANELSWQRSGNDTPAAFDLPGPTGISDHWPLTVDLRIGGPGGVAD